MKTQTDVIIDLFKTFGEAFNPANAKSVNQEIEENEEQESEDRYSIEMENRGDAKYKYDE
jgi:hypothetical protein